MDEVSFCGRCWTVSSGTRNNQGPTGLENKPAHSSAAWWADFLFYLGYSGMMSWPCDGPWGWLRIADFSLVVSGRAPPRSCPHQLVGLRSFRLCWTQIRYLSLGWLWMERLNQTWQTGDPEIVAVSREAGVKNVKVLRSLSFWSKSRVCRLSVC